MNKNSNIKLATMSAAKGDIFLEKRNTRSSTLHSHTYFELEIYLSGKGEVHLNDNILPIKKGVAVLIAPTDIHEIKSYDNSPIELLNLSFMGSTTNQDITRKILMSSGSGLFCFCEDDIEKACSLFNYAMSEQNITTPKSDDFSEKCIEALLTLALRYTNIENNPQKPSHISEAISYIHSHLSEEITLSNVADAVGLNSAYLSMLFSSQIGQSFKGYIINARIAYAKKLMNVRGISPTQSCYASGFNSYPSFLRAFKKATGISPVDYFKQKNDSTR